MSGHLYHCKYQTILSFIPSSVPFAVLSSHQPFPLFISLENFQKQKASFICNKNIRFNSIDMYPFHNHIDNLGREIHEIVEQLKKGKHHKKASNGGRKHSEVGKTSLEDGAISESTFNSSITGGDKMPEILFITAGHGKNSLIKTAAGGAAIAAAVTKLMKQQQQGEQTFTTIFEEEIPPIVAEGAATVEAKPTEKDVEIDKY
jgi:hypothetical protein